MQVACITSVGSGGVDCAAAAAEHGQMRWRRSVRRRRRGLGSSRATRVSPRGAAAAGTTRRTPQSDRTRAADGLDPSVVERPSARPLRASSSTVGSAAPSRRVRAPPRHWDGTARVRWLVMWLAYCRCGRLGTCVLCSWLLFLCVGWFSFFLPKGARFFITKKRSTCNAQPFYCQPVWGGVAPGTWTHIVSVALWPYF